MDAGTGAILIGVLVGVLILIYLNQREKNAVRRKRRRRFKPQWSDKDGATSKRRRP